MKIEKALNLLDQIIEKNLHDDFILNKGERPGVSWNIYYLNILKNLLSEIKDERQ